MCEEGTGWKSAWVRSVASRFLCPMLDKMMARVRGTEYDKKGKSCVVVYEEGVF